MRVDVPGKKKAQKKPENRQNVEKKDWEHLDD
jgi:hypothetical protein